MSELRADIPARALCSLLPGLPTCPGRGDVLIPYGWAGARSVAGTLCRVARNWVSLSFRVAMGTSSSQGGGDCTSWGHRTWFAFPFALSVLQHLGNAAVRT